MAELDSRDRGTGASRFWVTCYTDASYTRRAAGWGVWLRSARGRIVRHGACPPYVSSANEAEMAAIFAGVYLARKAWGAAVCGLFVFTDSQAAIGFLNGEALRPRVERSAPGIVRLRDRIRAFAAEHGIELDLRWVKGHQKTDSVRAYLNARCDLLAGAAREAAEKDGGRVNGTLAEKGRAERPRRSKKQKRRERRLRAREKQRARKAARAAEEAASGPSTLKGCA